ncbi:oligosaccharide flippase family protein [Mangrovibacterium marinum]|uniref:lipopolysaccharide biosynthesis protein n=1 Tax=Mangrovibacterium marinum TaxID=1639118 RepID=UPI002A187E8C|nr:oligosaccharide flippase family protein [Mangrovibacterium marinum]
MGIIIKQSIKGTIWSYLGVLMGFVTVAYLYPRFLSTDTVGLLGLLMAYTTLTSQFSLLGIQGVTARLFPRFRNKEQNHYGFVRIASIFMLVGFSGFLVLYYFFSPLLIQNNLEKSSLFADYFYLVLPLTFFSMLFSFLDNYNKLLYDAVFGIFLQEFLQRFFILVIISAFAIKIITLNALIWGYTAAACMKGIILLIHLVRNKEIRFAGNQSILTPHLKREILDVAFFSILGGLGSMIIFNIDKIIINQMLDLSNTGVYTIAFYFGTLVIIPSRPLLKISGTLIADAWHQNDMTSIRTIYYKSCINQFIIGGFIFTGIWTNISNILEILGPEYAASKWVIFFIGIGYLFDMMTGANTHVISYSSKYRISLLFTSILIILVILLIYLFIPLWGITGAAVAVALALFLNNTMRYVFLYKKYKLQPFNLNFITVTILYAAIIFITDLIPQFNIFADLLIRGTVVTGITVATVLALRISPDINNTVEKIVKSVIAKKSY